MKREVVRTPLAAIGLPPEDFSEQAQRALGMIPDVFDEVYAGPEFSWVQLEDGYSWPAIYIGARFFAVKGDRMVQWMTESSQMHNADISKAYVTRALHALASKH